jgi:TolB-like protein
MAPGVERRLAAILVADVVGYSHLVEQNEAGTLAALKEIRREVIDPLLAAHHGRIVKLMGDGAIAEFGSVVDAVACAVAVQKGVTERQADVPPERRIVFRIGINLGDVVVEGDDLLGDGVNIAARLEQLCEPGGVMISGTAYDHLQGKLDVPLEFAGEPRVKNIDRPIRTYRVRLDSPGEELQTGMAGPGDKPSIAVLPFTNMSGDPEQDHFSDGITEDIIAALSRLRWFVVIARTSTFVYKDHPADVRQVGRDLGVRYVLEGSVRRSGQRVRITVQLIDAAGAHHLWAERYDRELTDIFAVQDEIATHVTAALEPKLIAAEGIRADRRSAEDLDAWDLVARGVSHFWKLTAGECNTGISILREAVHRYPDYAPAHSMLAFALVVAAYVGMSSAGAEREFASRLAHRAVDLDEEDPWAHAALGYLAFTSRRTGDAIRHFQTALNLNPNFAAAHGALGWTFVFDGRSEQALACFEQALRMSPRDPLNGFILAGIAAAHYFAGHYPDAVTWARKAVELRPGLLGGHRVLCASLAQAGQLEDASTAVKALRLLQPNVSLAWVQENVPYTARPMVLFLDGLRRAGLPDG